MQLVRIITDQPENSFALSDQLRSNGFEVQTVSPDQIPSHPVDFEIRLSEYTLEKALQQIEAQANSRSQVFVAAGALDPKAERSAEKEPIALPPEVLAALQDVLASDPRFAEPAEPATDKEMTAPTGATSQENLLPALIDAPDFKMPESILAMSDYKGDGAPKSETKDSGGAENAEPAQDDPVEVTHSTEYQHAPQAVSQNEEASSVAEELPLSDWLIWQPAMDKAPAAPIRSDDSENEVETRKVQEPSLRAVTKRETPRVSLRGIAARAAPSTTFLKVACAAGVLAIVALIFSMAYHRARPLPQSWTQNQPVPFVREAPEATTHLASDPAAAYGTIARATAILAQPRHTSVKSARSTSDALSQPTNLSSTTQSPTASETDYVAKDTVTHYGHRPATHKNKGQTSGIKYYSDLK